MALINHYPLSDNAASTVVDDPVGGDDGVLEGGDNTSAKTTAGPGGTITSGFDLNGSDDAIDISAATLSFASGTAFSVSCWASTDDTVMQLMGIVGSATTHFMRLASATSFRVRGDGGEATFVIPDVTGGAFHHILVTRTAGNSLRCFVDGTESVTGTVAFAQAFSPTYLGRRGSAFHNGKLAGVRIYNSDESANVATLYAEGSADAVAPTLDDIILDTDGETYTLTFSENVTGTGGFSAVGTTAGEIGLTYVSGSGTATHVYTGDTVVYSDEDVVVDYTPGTLVDDADNALAAINNQSVTNGSEVPPPSEVPNRYSLERYSLDRHSLPRFGLPRYSGADGGSAPDTTAPTITGVTANGSTWTVTFSEAVTGQTGFSGSGTTTGAITLTGAGGNGTLTHIFTGSAPAVFGETLTLDYAAGNAQDAAGNALATVNDRSVTNETPDSGDAVAPTITGVTVAGTVWEFEFSENVTGQGGFSGVGSTTGAIALTYYSGSGTDTHTYTGDVTAIAGETLTYDYDDAAAANDLEDGAGNKLADVNDGATTNITGSEPILAIPATQMVAEDGAINFTPSVTQGSSITFTAEGLPTGASIDSGTGAVTGTLTVPGLYHPKITATNGSGYYEIWLPVIVYSGSVQNIDQAWYDLNGGSLTGTNKLYRLTEDIDADGTGFTLAATVYLDLGGFELTYDNETPPAIANGSFESGTGAAPDDWDLTSATGAERIGPNLSFGLRERAWTGDYSLQFTYPHTGEAVATNTTAVALTSGQTYALTASFAGSGLTAPYDADRWVQLSNGTHTHDTMRYAGNISLSNLLLVDIFDCLETDDYTLSVHIEDTVGKTGKAYCDDIRLTFFDRHGVAIADGCAVVNGTITQAGTCYESHAVHIQFADNFIVAGVTGTTVGHSSAFSSIHTNGDQQGDGSHDQTSGGGTGAFFADNDIHSQSGMIQNREEDQGYALIFKSGIAVHNRIHESCQGGISFRSPALAACTVAYNEIHMQSRYTNGSGIITNGNNYGSNDLRHSRTDIYRNTIDTYTDAADGGRGIHVTYCQATDGIYVYKNTITVKELDNNSEYGGGVLEGVYGIQLEGAADVTVEFNTVHAYGYAGTIEDVDAKGLAVNGDHATRTYSSLVRNNTFAAHANGVDGTFAAVAAYYLSGDAASESTFESNNSQTDYYWAYVTDDYAGSTHTGENITITGTTKNPFNVTSNGGAEQALTLVSPTYADSTSQDFIENDLNWRRWGTLDATSVAPVVV